ncbi:heavy metal-binding domain-containing protein [Hymenobacter fodinae]|uniref:Heavy metal binding domain-containing protein n=1 Tax=Hymenobacter fodinae TaxID=2510796 RepID=A0A4Z0PAY8_9BACT|nr:heavy metal-binding domain-containing protein [Hymenobacter fodinae]TGE09433.1 hypothetical protein EU556_00950 [Hymenobacter fodinae]
MRNTSWKSWVASGLVAMAASFASCQQKPAEQTAVAPAAATPVKTAAYVCPMGCEGSASDKPGKCPVCGMDLEPNPTAKATAAPTDSL